jgi:hypothetical protein
MFEKPDFKNGAFGKYERMSTGHVLNALCHWGIPVTQVETFYTTPKHEIKNNRGQVIGRYKYFDGIEQPLFYFNSPYEWNNHQYTTERIEERDYIRPNFRLQLSPAGTPGLLVDQKELATPLLHRILCATLTNWMKDPWYAIHKDAGAFFQGGYGSPEGEYFYIEFWQSKGAQAYIDRLNSEYINMTKFYERM